MSLVEVVNLERPTGSDRTTRRDCQACPHDMVPVRYCHLECNAAQ